jgi:hypothetical protein
LKNCGENVTKRKKLWLQVNLTRSHNTKQPRNLEVLLILGNAKFSKNKEVAL